MFQLICLRGCPYSEEAAETFHKLFPASAFTIKWIEPENKDRYKTVQRTTFPQISFFVKNSKGKQKEIFIGGWSEFQDLHDMVKQLQNKNYNAQIIIPMMKIFAAEK